MHLVFVSIPPGVHAGIGPTMENVPFIPRGSEDCREKVERDE